MAKYTKRIQAVLTGAQYETLTQLAQASGKPISVLIREAVDIVYIADATRQRRQKALAKLLSLNAPTADWPQMESEIIEGALK